MASFEPFETPHSRVGPALLVGAVSPLWTYFGAAAAGGLAYWWMSRWARPVNLEALFAQATAVQAPVFEPVLEAAEAVVEAVAESQAAFAETVLEAAPLAVGGESAPIGPLLEATPALEPQATPEPELAEEVIFAVAPEPVIDEPPPVAEAMVSEPFSKPRVRKSAAPPEFDA